MSQCDITMGEGIKAWGPNVINPALDLFTIVVDAASVIVLMFVLFAASRALHGFRQSRQTITESASLVAAIVNALTSRIELSESMVEGLQSEFEKANRRSSVLEEGQRSLRSTYLQLLRHLEGILSNDHKLVSELEQLKVKLATFKERPPSVGVVSPERSGLPIGEGDILARLTETERQTIEILAREGPKAAPDLGRRLKKSREHTSRLMKKLYLEGYIDRESNRAPYRYKLNEKILASLTTGDKTVTAKPSERV